ncbi:APC family permease [Pseudomonas sp. NPDC088444]|uniref:APC family permease n=1 Tax=Pseudomonas sp. NPDC088444 TaxID=3364456 RepID=UPI00384CDA4E
MAIINNLESMPTMHEDVGALKTLSGKMGAMSLMLTVLAFSAPIAVVEGFIPLAITFGGPGACFAFLLSMVILLMFAVGYLTMSRHAPKPGNFYSFINSGLGNTAGLGSAFLASFGYLCILGGSYLFLGISASSMLESLGLGAHSWITCAFGGWLIVSVLGYFNIELSARLLTIAMIIEVVIVMTFNICVIGKGGAEGLNAYPVTPTAFGNGDMAVALLYTISVFVGFEATTLFRDEVTKPDVTIPRATYGAVIFIGLLYALSTYAMVSAYGASAWDVAKATPTSMFADAMGRFVSPAFTQVIYSSVTISIFAALLSVHNVLSRYVMNLSIDGAFPNFLSRVHVKHNSPHVASMFASAVVFICLIPLVINTHDASALFGVVVGIGSIGIIFLMSLVCLAVIGWFARNGIPEGENAFKVFIAPAIAGITLIFITIFVARHLDLMVGGAPGESNWILYVLTGVFICGLGMASYFKYFEPKRFAALGRAHLQQ